MAGSFDHREATGVAQPQKILGEAPDLVDVPSRLRLVQLTDQEVDEKVRVGVQVAIGSTCGQSSAEWNGDSGEKAK